MRLPLLLGLILVWDLRFCHSNEADSSENLNHQNHQRSIIPPFRKDLYPQEYKVNFPIPLVFSDDGSNLRTASAASSSAESKSVEDISTTLLSKKRLQVSKNSHDRSSIDSSDSSEPSRDHQGRGVFPKKIVYYRGANTKPKKKIRKTRPKITAVWGPPRKHSTSPHKPHYHGPPSHGPPHVHGPSHYYHGPPHHHHPHHYHHHHHGHHHHGWTPKRHRPSKNSHIVAIWKENKPGWRPSKHKTFKRIDLLPAYLSDLSYRLKDGLGIISKPNKHHGHGHHGKTPVTYHSGFYTEVQ